MNKQQLMQRAYSRRGFVGLAGTAALTVGLTAATAWADAKNPNDSWSTARTDSASHTVTDMDGDAVDLPQMPARIADAWGDNVAMLCALNGGVGLVATATSPQTHPWLYTIVPTVREATTTFDRGFSPKEVEALKPDVIFADDDDLRDVFKQSAIPVVDVECDSFDEVRKALGLMGEVLGGEAIERASDVVALFDSGLDEVRAFTAMVDDADRPSVLYGTSVYTGVIDGTDALSNEWITAAGGCNANPDDEDEDEAYDVARVIAMNPDVIVTGVPSEVEQILGDAAWAGVPAVQQGQVYACPRGVNSWAAPGPELMLQVQWLASKLYPDQMSNDDMVRHAHDFYLALYDFDASSDQIELMFDAQPPAATENGLTEAQVDYAASEEAKEQAESGNIPRQGPIDTNLPGMEAQDTVME